MLIKILDGVRKVTNVLVILLFAAVVVIVFGQVIMRYGFKNSLSWADETSRYCFVWLVYLGGTITIREGRNVCFDLVLESWPPRMYKIMFTLVSLIGTVFLAIVMYLGILVCQVNVGETSPIVSFPMELVYISIPLGGALMFVEQISYWLMHVKDRDPGKTRWKEGVE